MKMHELLTDASRWTQGTNARDRQGRETLVWMPGACQWCLLGALRHCYGDVNAIRADQVLARIKRAIGIAPGTALWDWNDAPDRKFADVRTLLLRLDV